MLIVKDLVKKFGGLVAVDGVEFKLEEKKILGLIGPNGSGKTTCLNIITGIYTQDKGTIKFKGKEIQNLEPHFIHRLGIARTFQNVRLIENQYISDNINLGYHFKTNYNFWDVIFNTKKFKEVDKIIREEIEEIIDFIGLKENKDELVGNLPYGKKRLVEIGRALISVPDILLMDEPAAGLNSIEKKTLSKIVKDIRKRGTSIILVDHEMDFVSEIVDRVIVLNFGKKIAEGTFKEIVENSEVKKAYLGKGGVEIAKNK